MVRLLFAGLASCAFATVPHPAPCVCTLLPPQGRRRSIARSSLHWYEIFFWTQLDRASTKTPTCLTPPQELIVFLVSGCVVGRVGLCHSLFSLQIYHTANDNGLSTLFPVNHLKLEHAITFNQWVRSPGIVAVIPRSHLTLYVRFRPRLYCVTRVFAPSPRLRGRFSAVGLIGLLRLTTVQTFRTTQDNLKLLLLSTFGNLAGEDYADLTVGSKTRCTRRFTYLLPEAM